MMIPPDVQDDTDAYKYLIKYKIPTFFWGLPKISTRFCPPVITDYRTLRPPIDLPNGLVVEVVNPPR